MSVLNSALKIKEATFSVNLFCLSKILGLYFHRMLFWKSFLLKEHFQLLLWPILIKNWLLTNGRWNMWWSLSFFSFIWIYLHEKSYQLRNSVGNIDYVCIICSKCKYVLIFVQQLAVKISVKEGHLLLKEKENIF